MPPRTANSPRRSTISTLPSTKPAGRSTVSSSPCSRRRRAGSARGPQGPLPAAVARCGPVPRRPTATDRVRPRGEPLVRQGLPRGVGRHARRIHHCAERGDEVVRLPRRRGGDEHRALMGEPGDRDRADAGRRGEISDSRVGAGAPASSTQRMREGSARVASSSAGTGMPILPSDPGSLATLGR
jgi:hypothetical protein